MVQGVYPHPKIAENEVQYLHFWYMKLLVKIGGVVDARISYFMYNYPVILRIRKGSLAPHLVGKYIIPGQTKQQGKFFKWLTSWWFFATQSEKYAQVVKLNHFPHKSWQKHIKNETTKPGSGNGVFRCVFCKNCSKRVNCSGWALGGGWGVNFVGRSIFFGARSFFPWRCFFPTKKNGRHWPTHAKTEKTRKKPQRIWDSPEKPSQSYNGVVDLARKIQAAKPWKPIFRSIGTICGGLFPKMYGTNLQPCINVGQNQMNQMQQKRCSFGPSVCFHKDVQTHRKAHRCKPRIQKPCSVHCFPSCRSNCIYTGLL